MQIIAAKFTKYFSIMNKVFFPHCFMGSPGTHTPLSNMYPLCTHYMYVCMADILVDLYGLII